MPFGGSSYDREIDGPWMKTQLYHVYAIMRDGCWRTPYQMMTDIEGKFGRLYPGTASLTARVRDFRKAPFGGHTVNIRRVAPESSVQEYQLITNPAAIEILYQRWVAQAEKKKKPKPKNDDPLADFQP